MQNSSAQYGALPTAEGSATALTAESPGVGTSRRPIVLALWQNENGVIAVLTALALTVLIGIVGLAVDVAMWYRTTALCKTRRIPQ
jgi:Flp pilus assembly protein TadG